MFGRKIRYDDILLYDLKVKKKKASFSLFKKQELVLYITLKSNEVLTFSSKSNDFDLLEIKGKLDNYFMEKSEYIQLDHIYKKIVDYVVKCFDEKDSMKKINNDNIILEELYKMNEAILLDKFSMPIIPLDSFDLYYDSSYRFFTYDSAWDACSNRRNRMERESAKFLTNYNDKIFEELKKYIVNSLNSYLITINDLIIQNHINLNNNIVSISLDSIHAIDINMSSLALSQNNIKVLCSFIDSTKHNIDKKSITVGYGDFDIRDNGKRLLSKAYGYVIYKGNVQNSLQKICEEYQMSCDAQNIIDFILCAFIESVTACIKNRN